MTDLNCPRCKGLGGYPKCPACQNVPAQSLAPATGSVADDDNLARDMACALWECSKLRHGLFTPVEFIPLVSACLRQYLAKKKPNKVDHQSREP